MNKYLVALISFIIGACMIVFIMIHYGNKSEVCLDSERQYIQAKCVWNKTKTHGVCRSDEIEVYFNFSGGENLPENEINEMAEGL